MNIYKKYTRTAAFAPTGYDSRMAKKMLNAHPEMDTVSFANRGDGKKLRQPKPGEIIYVKATGGKWGRSSQQRFGAKKTSGAVSLHRALDPLFPS